MFKRKAVSLRERAKNGVLISANEVTDGTLIICDLNGSPLLQTNSNLAKSRSKQLIVLLARQQSYAILIARRMVLVHLAADSKPMPSKPSIGYWQQSTSISIRTNKVHHRPLAPAHIQQDQPDTRREGRLRFRAAPMQL